MVAAMKNVRAIDVPVKTRNTEASERPITAQKAQKVILPFKYKLTDFESDGKQVSFSLPEEASAGVDILTEELEKSKDFSQVTPVFDKARRRVVFTMTVQAAGRGE